MTVITLSCLWVFAATAVACLPMRYQYGPGIILLLAAPVLIVLMGMEFGWWIGAFALFAFVSMFRKPLRYFARRALGRKATPHQEEQA